MKRHDNVIISFFAMMLIFTYSTVLADDYERNLLKRAVNGSQVISEQLFEQGNDFIQIGDYILNRPQVIYIYNPIEKHWNVFKDEKIPMFSVMKAVIGEQQEDYTYSVQALGIIEFKDSVDMNRQKDDSALTDDDKTPLSRDIILKDGVYTN